MTDKAIATTEPARVAQTAEAPETREERSYLAPPVDIYEVNDGLAVVADLPGVDPKGVEVRVDNGLLTIVGHVARDNGGDAAYQEFTLRDYYRQFRLHEEADPEKISAELKQGVLRVFLPQREEVKPRQIAVQVR